MTAEVPTEKPKSLLRKPRRFSLKEQIRETFRQYGESILFALLIGLILRFFVVGAFHVTNENMIPSLKMGDFIFVYRLPYGLKFPFGEKRIGSGWPQRGEIAVFECPHDRRQYCVKRVVGLPGDRIAIRGKRLFINKKLSEYKRVEGNVLDGVPGGKYLTLLEEGWPSHEQSHLVAIGPAKARENFGPVVVPPGHFFALNDNRDLGHDSRNWGPVPKETLVGRASLIWLSLRWDDPQQRLPEVRWSRLFDWLN